MRVEPLIVVGAGAAGLMAAIHAGRAGTPPLLLDGARVLGAKILLSGGGRCNVTHDVVDERAYAGSSPRAIRKVLLRFDVARTVAFFAELGVELKREETGKLFPTTDRARSVLDALLAAAHASGAELRHPWRVEEIARDGDGFALRGPRGKLRSRRVVLATGGMSLPKSGSDGHGLALARALGHTVTPHVVPALVGLVLADGCFVKELSGLTLDTTLAVRTGGGKRLAATTGSTLCTHFGLSGPAPMDISRHWQLARMEDARVELTADWTAGGDAAGLDRALQGLGAATPLRTLAERLPARLARALCANAGIDPAQPGHALTRERRHALVRAATATVLPVTGTRGWDQAEATAGGVPLNELKLETMESRVCPGLYVCGEMCDVDGRIGGYNFQWAWASGHVAGTAAAA